MKDREYKSGFGSQMRDEVLTDLGVISMRSRREGLFAYMTGYAVQFAGVRNKKNQVITESICGDFRRPSVKDYRKLYFETCDRLNFEYPSAAYERTSAEKIVSKIIRSHTNLQYKVSVWIGSKNVDILFPMIAGTPNGNRRHHGLAIEVNGKIHDYYHKMKKDLWKEETLFHLGIGLVTVENIDATHNLVLQIAEQLRFLPRLDSRARARVWLRIYLETIICEATDWQLSQLFGIDFGAATESYQFETRGLFNDYR